LAHMFMDEMEKLARRPGAVWRGVKRMFGGGAPRVPVPAVPAGPNITTIDQYVGRHKEVLKAYRMYDEILKVGGPGAHELRNSAYKLHGDLWKDRRTYQLNLVKAYQGSPVPGSNMAPNQLEIENALDYLKKNQLPVLTRPKGIKKGLGDSLNESAADKYIKRALIGTGLAGAGYLAYQGMKPDKPEYQQVYYGR
jgi:hypothetical protein